MTTITKYFIGGEREAFIAGSDSGISWSTTAGLYDADFARGAVRLVASGHGKYIHAPLRAPQAECYVGFIHHFDTNSGVNPGAYVNEWFRFHNSALTGLFRVIGIGGTNTQPLLQWQYWNGAAWAGVGSGFVVPTDVIHKWDFEFFIDNSAGFARAYVDGRLLGELTGDTAFAAQEDLAEVRLMCAGTVGSLASTVVPSVSEMMILDTPTLGRRLATLDITGAGAGNTLTSGTYADVDDIGVYSDTDYASSDTAGQVATFVTSDLSTAAQQYVVDGLVIAYRAQKGGVGPQNLQGAVRIGGTNYFSSSVPTLVTAFGYTWADFPENPATAANFTPAEINTAGFETGLKSVA